MSDNHCFQWLLAFKTIKIYKRFHTCDLNAGVHERRGACEKLRLRPVNKYAVSGHRIRLNLVNHIDLIKDLNIRLAVEIGDLILDDSPWGLRAMYVHRAVYAAWSRMNFN